MHASDTRLLHVFKSFNIGGTEKSTILYSNHLSADFAFIGLFARKGVYDHSNIISQKLHQFFPPLNVGLNIFTWPLYLLRIIKIVRQHRITVLNFHHRVFIPIIQCIKILHPSLKIIYTAHCCFNDAINRFIAADKIIAVSEAVRQDLCRNYKTNIVIIPHGVQAFSKGRLQHDGRTIGFVGRFEHRKGIIPLINAAAILIRNNELRKLTLRGEGPLLKEIHAHIKKAGLERNIVTERPQIGNNDDLFSGIDLLVVPSLLPEGFGLVIIEAMAAGIPVVGSDTTGINEIIIDGYNGRLVPCGDVSALITAIRSIFDDKVFRESLIANGHHTVSMKYKVAMTTSLYCRLMTEL